MTAEEADKVIAIMLTADGECPYCVTELFEEFSKAWPEYKEACDQAYEARFGKGIHP
jgi:hypothetical protein